MDVVQTERALARLAVEVDMSVMMVALALFLAQFVVEYATSVLKGMHHIMLQEQGECTEYAPSMASRFPCRQGSSGLND